MLALPAGLALSKAWPDCHISFLADSRYTELLKTFPWIHAVLPSGPKRSVSQMTEDIRLEAPEAALFLYPRPRTALAVFLARVPLRVGPVGRWYSLLLFNRNLNLHRSGMDRHEASYNLELVQSLGIRAELERPRIPLTAPQRDEARALLEQSGLALSKNPLVVLHPGTGGSSPTWPEHGFSQLCSFLRRDGCGVAVTAGPKEEGLARAVSGDQGGFLTGLSLLQLAAVYSLARVVVAGSTGPLHLASASGASVVGLYSRALSSTPVRWGPLGPGRVLQPESPESSSMDGLPVEAVRRTVRELLEEK